MAYENQKRQRRIPFTAEEVEQLRIIKKMREHRKLVTFKKTDEYKILNFFNIACFFIYLELLFCYFGPCHYQVHYSYKVVPKYGFEYTSDLKPIVRELKVTGVNEKEYEFIINDFINIPQQRMRFVIGKDFLLQKELKGSVENLKGTYRLFLASPILLLCILIGFISFGGFVLNMNENKYSLHALSVVNALTLLGILFL